MSLHLAWTAAAATGTGGGATGTTTRVAITSAALGRVFTGATREEAFAKLRAARYEVSRAHPIFGSGYTNEEANEAARAFMAVTD